MSLRIHAAVVALAATAFVDPSRAQVTTDTDALKGLAPASSPHHAAPHRPAASRAAGSRGAATRHTAPRGHHAAGDTHIPTRAAAPPHPAVPRMPAHPPPIPIIAPPAIHVPLHPPPPPPPVAIDKTAKGTVSIGPGGVTILDFGSGSAGLNGAMMDAVRAATTSLLAHPDDIAVIDSAAAGSPDDPSMPRRLSLQRALAIRAVMINAGVPSTRIFARANGAPPSGDGAEPDRTMIAERDEGAPGAFAPVDPASRSGPAGETPNAEKPGGAPPDAEKPGGASPNTEKPGGASHDGEKPNGAPSGGAITGPAAGSVPSGLSSGDARGNGK